MGLGGVTSSLVTLKYIVNTQFYNQTLFNFIIIGLLIYILVRILQGSNSKDQIENPLGKVRNLSLLFSGIAGGIISALSGFGGGIIIIPLLTQILKLNIRVAHIISMGVIFLMSLSMSILNLFTQPGYSHTLPAIGNIIFPLALPLVAGVLIMAPKGIAMALKSREKTIRLVFSTFITLVIFKKIYELWMLGAFF